MTALRKLLKSIKMKNKKLSDRELMKTLNIDFKTLKRFKQIQKEMIQEAKLMGQRKNKKIKVLGVSGSARGKI